LTASFAALKSDLETVLCLHVNGKKELLANYPNLYYTPQKLLNRRDHLILKVVQQKVSITLLQLPKEFKETFHFVSLEYMETLRHVPTR